jgi:phospho-N-acetylmuramoyl-pentapeptide-transferase
VSFLVGPVLIHWLREVRYGQKIRAEGPTSHQGKAGTPTMGGLLILLAIVLPTLLWADLTNRNVLLALFATDRARGDRLPRRLAARRARRARRAARALEAARPGAGRRGGRVHAHPVPGRERAADVDDGAVPQVQLRELRHPVRAVRHARDRRQLERGQPDRRPRRPRLGLVAFAAVAFAGLCYVSGNVKFSEYLSVLYLPGSGELTVFCAAVLGASLGFLWFNCHPADVFMGDTGSLALGGALGTVAVLIKREFLLFVIGGVFVAEALSVMIQVASFKLRGKRVFLMSPLHHHFELKGWAESRVVTRFYIAAAILALVSLSTLKLQ